MQAKNRCKEREEEAAERNYYTEFGVVVILLVLMPSYAFMF